MDEDKPYRLYLCGGPTCAPRNVPAMLEALELILWECDLEELVDVRIGGCQSRCEYGPNLLIFPGGYRYSHLTTERLRDIIAAHMSAMRSNLVSDQAMPDPVPDPVMPDPAMPDPAMPNQAVPDPVPNQAMPDPVPNQAMPDPVPDPVPDPAMPE